jgi:(p)ppGpp synthase/HD superfamily hydrolase
MSAELPQIVQLAAEWHAGQLDQNGWPYLGHLERTAKMVTDSYGRGCQVQAAWLHDVIEDTACTVPDLVQAYVHPHVIEIVSAMTHDPHEPYADYIERVRSVEDAVLVKLCDIYDNLNPSRMAIMDAPTQRRLRTKYAKAIEILCS